MKALLDSPSDDVLERSGVQHVFLPAIVLCLVTIFAGVPMGLAQQPGPGVQWDPPMRIPSPAETSSWFPDLAVDSQGRVHVVWCETGDFAWQDSDRPSRGESVYYSVWNGQYWLLPNDIVPPQQDIIRNAIAIDGSDVLHLLFDHSPSFGLYYKRAPSGGFSSAAAWTSPRLVNNGRYTYMSDIAILEDVLHIVYDDRGARSQSEECPGCADIFYRRSTNGGATWSEPVNLYPTGAGSSRAQIEVDSAGTIHVAWDEGWDRLSGAGTPRYGVYVQSTDGGATWSNPTIISRPLVTPTITPAPTPVPVPTVTPAPVSAPMPTPIPRPTITPTVVSYPNSTNAQLSVGADGQGGVMLVWRTRSTEHPGIYYTWSADGGKSWSSPATLPGVVARSWGSRFDLYDMATDSAGHIHLLVVGNLSAVEIAPGLSESPPGLYHLEWDGESWTYPGPIYEGNWYPEYPRLVVHAGNQLHATWFAREDPWEATMPRQVWYAHGQSQASPKAPSLPPTPTPTAIPTPGPTAVPTSTPYPTVAPGSSTPPTGLRTETDDLFRLGMALIPVLIIVAAVIVLRKRRYGTRL